MRVARIDVFTGTLPESDSSIDLVQDVVIVRVLGDNGIEGFGETHSSPTIVRAIIEAPPSRTFPRGIKDIVQDTKLENPADLDNVLEELGQATYIVGRTGVVVHAVSALEHALWDLLGRSLGQPVWELLGGTGQSTMGPCAYTTAWAPTTDASLTRLADFVRDHRFSGLKIAYTAAGPPGGDEARYLKTVRDAVGAEVDLMVDLQRRSSLDRVVRLLDAYSDVGVRWIEEPFPANRFCDGYPLGTRDSARSRRTLLGGFAAAIGSDPRRA